MGWTVAADVDIDTPIDEERVEREQELRELRWAEQAHKLMHAEGDDDETDVS